MVQRWCQNGGMVNRGQTSGDQRVAPWWCYTSTCAVSTGAAQSRERHAAQRGRSSLRTVASRRDSNGDVTAAAGGVPAPGAMVTTVQRHNSEAKTLLQWSIVNDHQLGQ